VRTTPLKKIEALNAIYRAFFMGVCRTLKLHCNISSNKRVGSGYLRTHHSRVFTSFDEEFL